MVLFLEYLNCCMQVCFHVKRLSRSELSSRTNRSAESASFPRRNQRRCGVSKLGSTGLFLGSLCVLHANFNYPAKRLASVYLSQKQPMSRLDSVTPVRHG